MPKTFKEFVEEARNSGIPEVTIEELLAKKERGEPFTLIDVRDPDEWDKGTIPGATLLSKGKLELRIAEEIENPEGEIVLHCGGGSRSLLAAKALRDMGYPNVSSLAGGYRAWTDHQSAS